MSQIRHVFFGLWGDEFYLKSIIPVIKVVRKKYPDAHIVATVPQQLEAELVGVAEIDETLPVLQPGEVLAMAFIKKYDKTFLPVIFNQEQSSWQFESKWMKRAPLNTLSDYLAYRCLDDLIVTERESLPTPAQPAQA